MLRERKYVHFVYLVVDILLIGFSFYLPYCLRYNRGLIPNSLPNFRDYNLLFSLWGLSLIFLLNNHRLYSTDRALTIPKEIGKVIKCVIYASVLAGLAVFVLQMKFFSRLVFGTAAILLVLTLSVWRVVKRVFIRYRIAQGYSNMNVLIVGAGRAGKALAREIENHPYLGLKIVGFLDDAKPEKVLNYNVLSKINNLDYIVQQYFVDEIYVTIPSERRKVAEVLAQARRLNKTVWVLADNFTFLSSIEPENKNGAELPSFSFPFRQVRLDHVGFIPLISYIDVGPHGTEMILKRFLDILVSGTGLIILAPLFALIAFLIKLDNPGPVFYKCKRGGRKGKAIEIYKFRSMVMGAENHKDALRHKSDMKGPVFKIKSDPRVTRLGRLLRRYSLDELPQLINVIKGDMSLVGPRPLFPEEIAKLDIWQMRRLDVKPGLTCLWQVRGRSDLSFYKWMKWDLWYIDNWSFGLDLLILLWTIPAVLSRKGAY